MQITERPLGEDHVSSEMPSAESDAFGRELAASLSPVCALPLPKPQISGVCDAIKILDNALLTGGVQYDCSSQPKSISTSALDNGPLFPISAPPKVESTKKDV